MGYQMKQLEDVNILVVGDVMLCGYGCGKIALHQFKNGKWCCSSNHQKCEMNKEKHTGKNNFMYNKKEKNNPNFGRKHTIEAIEKIRKTHKGKLVSKDARKKLSNIWKNKKFSEEHKTKLSISKKGHNVSDETKRKISISNTGNRHTEKTKKIISEKKKYTIEDYLKKYPLFSKIEEMRYNPDNLTNYEIQVHCKNHNCPNCKEKEGWFTPTKTQIYERIRGIEIFGNDGSYFYCSKECKNECPLYGLQSDPFKKENKLYTPSEYNHFRKYVLDRDNYICQFCGNKAIDVHHEKPQKLEPFFSLDPDYAWSCCKKCHYEKGHKDECSSGNLKSVMCI
jgi:hypothetical protein